MRKLVIGIAVVALLGLLAVPAMAVTLATGQVEVEITVVEYGAIMFSPADLTLTVTDPWNIDPHPSGCSNYIDFTVLCNTNTTLRLDAPTSPATATPGGVGCWYPTATGMTASEESLNHRIGFGLVLYNTSSTNYESAAWPDTLTKSAAYVQVSFVLADVPGNLSDPNARVQINSYMDSARDDDALAPPGPYDATLDLTLSAP